MSLKVWSYLEGVLRDSVVESPLSPEPGAPEMLLEWISVASYFGWATASMDTLAGDAGPWPASCEVWSLLLWAHWCAGQAFCVAGCEVQTC